MKRVLLSSLMAVVACFTVTARAEVRLPKIFGDHMVLQQQSKVAIWGWADADEKVVVELGKSRAETKANADGKWTLRVETPKAGGPHELHVAGANTIKLTDVMVGEVWICSGQSNMEWNVANSNNPKEEIAAATHAKVRMIKVAQNPARETQEDIGGAWQVCSPDTVADFSAVGYFFARKLNQDLDVPIGMINTSWGGTICEAWTSREKLKSDEDFKPILERDANFRPGNPNQASALYNGMVKPLVPFTIKGAIWYQGESNLSRAEQYAKLFPAMITDWREQWKQGDFPFYFVQLAPFRYNGKDPKECAELWEAQLKTLSLPNTGMAVTTDIADIKDIHPRNKQDVGARLALWALAKDYGKELVHSGPLYDSHEIDGTKVRIKFKHAGGGLATKDDKQLTHFQIAGEDEKFVDATATIDGDSIVVHNDDVAKPVAVRFAWSDTAEPNFFNQEGLPASPFRTDSFKMVTAGNQR
jgi:sialate O-acetylesterase